MAPNNPKDKSFETITGVLKAHFEPKPLIIAQRFHFHRRDQAQGESVAEYLAELRRLASKCNFGSYLDEALRDRLVCGQRSEAIQKRLLSEPEPTLARVFEITQGVEAAHKQAQTLKTADTITVKKVDRRAPPQESAVVRGKPCYRCGKIGHAQQNCGFREATCHARGKRGHISRVCKSSRGQNRSSKLRARWVDSDPQPPQETGEEVLFHVGQKSSHPYQVTLELEGRAITMEIDTGASVSLISEELQKTVFPDAHLTKPTSTLRTYTSELIPVVGQMTVKVKYGDYVGYHKLYVVKGKGPSLLGRDWLKHIRLDWANIKMLSMENSPPALKELSDKYAEVFQDGLGTMKSFRAHLSLKESATPRFHCPRPVPFAIKDAVGRELDRLEEAGILRKIDHSEWAAPVVPVPKKDGTIHLCGDYKVTINPALQVDQYPLPNPTELMASLTGGKQFTKLDLTSAYQQMLLDSESAKLVTINTHQGLYEYTRLP